MEFENALHLCIEVQDSLQQIQPYPQTQIICCQGIIDDIYLAQKKYAVAEAFYTVAFELNKRFLFVDDRCRIRCVKALVSLHQQQGSERQAITFCLEQLSFHQTHLGEDDTSVAYLLIKLEDFYTIDDQQKLQTFKKALHILEKNVHHEYATTFTCLMMLAKCCVHWKEHEQALKYYLRALEIHNKIYPANHSKIIETQNLIESIESNPN